MILELETYQAIGLAVTIGGSIWGAGKAFFTRFETALRERDDGLKDELSKLSRQVGVQTGEVRQLEKDLLQLKAELPAKYVHKSDFNRTFTVVEAKLDRLYGIISQNNNKD
ncbi:hypothetical protein [Psychrobacter lutiphocae]|uniref:hypothetical protein n=1 Tax=Psychrobacter lutiphocae TaxID=540500 RepID=UPI000370ACC1|nr:hypothetical protein [Psychrobacter lutiphocae]